jgi:hypothetical protein
MGLSQASWYCHHPRGRRVRDFPTSPRLAEENHSNDFSRQPAKARFAYLRLLVSERCKIARAARLELVLGIHPNKREEGRGT